VIRKYDDLDLWVEPDPERGYRIRASAGRRSEQEWFASPFTPEELAALREDVCSGRGREFKLHSSEHVSPRKLGKKLYETVFTGAVRDLLNDSLPRSTSCGLRLRLHLHARHPEISEWPWELLFRRNEFLALSVHTPVVRHPEYGNPLPALRASHPLRVLVVITSSRGHAALDSERELAEIRKALRWLLILRIVRIERLETPTLAALEERLEHGSFHVLHFIGHGTFNSDAGEGALLFEHEDGTVHPVSGEKLASVLGPHRSMRLVVLNACEGARVAGGDPFSGVAQSLVLQRIPAVVAMQYPIEDRLAVFFSRRFYTALVRGRAVDWAITKARHAMHAAGGNLGWAIPVLFLTAQDARLFRWRPSKGLVAMLGLIVAMLLGYWSWYRSVSTIPPPPPRPAYIPCPSPHALPAMRLVLVHGGTFQMGSEAGEQDEAPVHEVTISSPLCLGATEVTQEEWTEIMGANSNPSKERGNSLPVSGVSYEDAQEFLLKLNEKEGSTIFRLPTEAEWELAAQEPGGWNCNTDRLASVGSLQPNRLGLYDMLGSVWEWAADWYGPYEKGPLTDPKGPQTGTERVRRGGSAENIISNCRVTRRETLKPNSRYKNTGFRVLRELKTP
jgi:formylglycine-generating enzyme required for sulfatase activity